MGIIGRRCLSGALFCPHTRFSGKQFGNADSHPSPSLCRPLASSACSHDVDGKIFSRTPPLLWSHVHTNVPLTDALTVIDQRKSACQELIQVLRERFFVSVRLTIS